MFLACFLVAEVLSVSSVAVWGCAVVMGVSCWPASAVAVVLLVSKPPCRCVLCAKKFALRAQNGPKWAFYGVLGEVFAVEHEGARCWARFVAGQSPLERSGWEVLPRWRVHHAP